MNEDALDKFYKLFYRLQRMFGLTMTSRHNCKECFLKVSYRDKDLFSIKSEPDHLLNLLDPDDLQESDELRIRTYERAYKQLLAWAENKSKELNINITF